MARRTSRPQDLVKTPAEPVLPPSDALAPEALKPRANAGVDPEGAVQVDITPAPPLIAADIRRHFGL
jgi:hypothetical protein